MYEWEKWRWGRRHASLDELARVLNLPSSKQEMDGSKVYEEFCAGRHNQIACYCMKDVELTRQVYYRLTFTDVDNQAENQTEDYQASE